MICITSLMRKLHWLTVSSYIQYYNKCIVAAAKYTRYKLTKCPCTSIGGDPINIQSS